MSDDHERVRLRAREGEVVEWTRRVAQRAGTLKDMMDDAPTDDGVYPVPTIAAAELAVLREMCEADSMPARLEQCSISELFRLVEGASFLDAPGALNHAQRALASRLNGKRADELRELLGATDDFEGVAGPRTRSRAQRARDERVEALAEPAFTPDNSTLQYTITIMALDVNDDVAEVALAEVSVGTLIELKGVSRAWCALGRRVLSSKLCRHCGDQAYPRQLDEITELNLELLIEAGRPWEAVRAGRLLRNLSQFTGYGFVVNVVRVRLVSLDSDGANDSEGEEAEEEELSPHRVLALAKRALRGCVAFATLDGQGDPPPPPMLLADFFFATHDGQGDPPPLLLLGAIAGAGSGEICQIPVEELRNDMLQELELNDPWPGYEIGPEGALLVASFIPCSRVMTSLKLFANNIGDAGAKAIAEALKVKPSLTLLDLGSNRIGSEGARAIADALKMGAGVVEGLWLIQNNIGDDGAEAFADALKASTTKLTTLNLNCNHITDSGASAIADVFRVGRTRLTMLGLEDNDLGAAGERLVLDALARWDGIELEISCQGD